MEELISSFVVNGLQTFSQEELENVTEAWLESSHPQKDRVLPHLIKLKQEYYEI